MRRAANASAPTFWQELFVAGRAVSVGSIHAATATARLYRTWREADPSLELDAAATAGEALASRAAEGREPGGGLRFARARRHAEGSLGTAGSKTCNGSGRTDVQPLPDLAPAPDEIRFANRESITAGASAAAFAKDPDRAIQQLRQAFQREQAALEALKASVADRQQAEDKASKAVSAAEQARAKAMQQYPFLSSALAQSADAMNGRAAAMGRLLSRSWRTRPESPPPRSPAGPAPAPGVERHGEPRVPPRVPRRARLPSRRCRSPVTWEYGAITRAAVFRFRAGSRRCGGARRQRPRHRHLLRALQGASGQHRRSGVALRILRRFQAHLNQTFTLETNEGADGTVDLNPGRAFNVLEVNFSTEVKRRENSSGRHVLLKQ